MQEQFLLDSKITLHMGGGFGFGTEAVADVAGSKSCTGKAADGMKKTSCGSRLWPFCLD